jgi:riboflavin synthase alpha subunit
MRNMYEWQVGDKVAMFFCCYTITEINGMEFTATHPKFKEEKGIVGDYKNFSLDDRTFFNHHSD